MIFNGDQVFGMERCEFRGIKLMFDGRAALVVTQLKRLYNDPAFKPLLTGVLDKKE